MPFGMRDPLQPSRDLEDLPVYDMAEVPIGDTFGVLTEAGSGLVRYFDVAIESRRRHVLVPVGHARLEKHLGRYRLRLRAATVGELEHIPAYEPHTAWDEDTFQNELLTAFGRLFQGERYYAHPAFDHSGLYAGAHPIVREPLAPASATGLRRLSAAPDFGVAEGEPDIRGWNLIGEAGATIGRVTDLIIETAAEQVRYVIVERNDGTETALPIGYVDLEDRTVHAPLSADDLARLPRHSDDALDRATEANLRAALESVLSGPRRYQRPDFRSAA
ncbi:MAG: PRC-barrel domain-containing protein [Gemmatimonadota bacterium]